MNLSKKALNVLLLVALVLSLFPATLLAQETEAMACQEDVVVQADDWLSKYAEKFFGYPMAYPAIVEATNALAATDESYTAIDNPDVIEIGQKVCIPADMGDHAMSEDMMMSEDTSEEAMSEDTSEEAMSDASSEEAMSDDTMDSMDGTMTLPKMVLVENPGFRPEGIEYDMTHERFLLGSLAHGTVYEIADDGSHTPFIEDPDLVSSVGIEVDEANNRLLVPNSDAAVFSGAAGQAMLGIYDLTTGERQAMIDLTSAGPEEAGSHFANDITVDAAGNIYVTNSMASVIYKVDGEGNVAIFVPNQFDEYESFFLNGIVYHPNGYLLAAESRNGLIYKIPVDDPTAISQVALPEPLVGADGILLRPNGNLIVVLNSQLAVTELSSSDDYTTATVEAVATLDQMAPTGALRGDEVYVISGHFGEDPQPDVYEIVLVALE